MMGILFENYKKIHKNLQNLEFERVRIYRYHLSIKTTQYKKNLKSK
jgi:hypothetical protein